MTSARLTPRPAVALVAAVAALLLTALSVVTAPPAAAHNTLTASDPAADAVISAVPQTFSLTFNAQVKDEFVTVVLTPDGGAPITLTPAVSGPTVTATLPDAAQVAGLDPEPGQGRAYRLGYRVISADDHPVSGSIDFTVGTTALPFGGGASSGVADPPADATTVDAAVAPAGSSSDSGTPTIWWVAAGVLVLAVGAAVMVRRARRRRSGRQQLTALTPPR